jgi:hypothetical protein
MPKAIVAQITRTSSCRKSSWCSEPYLPGLRQGQAV